MALLLAATTLVPLPQQTETRQAPPPPPELAEALSDVESGEAEAEAEAVAGEQGLVASGTPCTMRHSRVAPGVDRSLRHRLAAATLATDPATKDGMLAALEPVAPAGPAQWRIALARAELAVRDERPADALSHLDRAAAADMADWCRGDELFLRAAATSGVPEQAALLDAAVAADPGFWAAQERLALLAARGTGGDATSCGRDAARTIRATVQMGALATRDAQFERLEGAVVGLEPNGRTAFLHAMILSQTGRQGRAKDRLQAALAKLGPSDCDAMLRLAFQQMLQTFNEETP